MEGGGVRGVALAHATDALVLICIAVAAGCVDQYAPVNQQIVPPNAPQYSYPYV